MIRSRVNDFTLSQSCCGVALFRSCSFIPPDLGPNARADPTAGGAGFPAIRDDRIYVPYGVSSSATLAKEAVWRE